MSHETEYLVLVSLLLTCDKKYTLVGHYVEKLLLIFPLGEESVQAPEHQCSLTTLMKMEVAA